MGMTGLWRDSNSLRRMLSAMVDDQKRRVEYWLHHLGRLRKARFNQTFDGSGNGGQMAQVKNTWHWKGGMGQ